MGKKKIAIISSRGSSNYSRDALTLHITDWEEVEESEIYKIQQGLSVLNKTNNMSYSLICFEDTSAIVIKSLGEEPIH